MEGVGVALMVIDDCIQEAFQFDALLRSLELLRGVVEMKE